MSSWLHWEVEAAFFLLLGFFEGDFEFASTADVVDELAEEGGLGSSCVGSGVSSLTLVGVGLSVERQFSCSVPSVFISEVCKVINFQVNLILF